ncbi:MAG: hypothetical protein AAF420_08360 [Pseudomonadota bacterium]
MAAALVVSAGVHSAEVINFDASERNTIASFGPWPPAFVADPSNRFSANPSAIALGARLFGDPGLSHSR